MRHTDYRMAIKGEPGVEDGSSTVPVHTLPTTQRRVIVNIFNKLYSDTRNSIQFGSISELILVIYSFLGNNAHCFEDTKISKTYLNL